VLGRPRVARYEEQRAEKHMEILEPYTVLLGSRSSLARALSERLGEIAVKPTVEHLPDGEVHAAIGCPLRGRRGYVVQALGTPVGERLLELALIADAAHRAGASELVAVIPYLGYSRHDHRTREDEPLGAAVVARLLATCGFGRIVTLDLHAPSVEGFFSCPTENLTAEPLLAEALRPFVTDAVVVAPDLGALKLARRFAVRLDLPLAVVHKSRVSPREVVAHQLVGDVRGRRPIIVDDMISTGRTIAAAVDAAIAAGAVREAVVAATHGVFAPGSDELLASKPIRALVVTDSIEPLVPLDALHNLKLQRLSLAPMLADVITRLVEHRPLHGLLAVT
jgi:ribose-phosphate pyrophosphokinase